MGPVGRRHVFDLESSSLNTPRSAAILAGDCAPPRILVFFATSFRGSGARGTHPVSGMRGSRRDIAPLHSPPAKRREAWASSGLGLVEPRCNRLKRSYTRACARVLREGAATFKDRPLNLHQVPFRLNKIIYNYKQPTLKFSL